MTNIETKLRFELDKINLRIYYLHITREEALAKADYLTASNCILESAKLERTKKILKAILAV